MTGLRLWVQQSEQISESKNSFEPRAEEDRSIVIQNLFSNLKRKRNETIPSLGRKKKGISLRISYGREVIGSSRTLNLVRKRGKASIHQESQTSCRRGKEHHFESRAKERRSYRVIKNSKPRMEERQSINSSGILNPV